MKLFDMQGKILPKFTSSHIIYSYKGVVKAGLQFKDIKVDVNENSKTVYVDLPEPEILSSEIDNDSLEIYDEKYSLLNSPKFEDFNESIGSVKEKARESAIENGLLDTAEENAKKLIETSILSLMGKEYTVKFN